VDVSLVCRWNEIIGTSIGLMGRFQLILYKTKSEIKGAETIQRKYQAALVRNLEDSLDVICRHNLQSLKICISTKISTLIQALNILRSLKNFDAENIRIIDDLPKISDSAKKVSTKIEQLKCDFQMIKIFNCCTVKELEATCQGDVDDIKLAFDFLLQQTNLEDLSLSGSSFSELFALPDICDLKCSLKKFHYCSTDPFLHYESFIKFLNQQKESLTILEVDFSTEPQVGIEYIHKFALENIVNLKHLKLGYIESLVDGSYRTGLAYNELPAATEITKNLESLAFDAQSSDMNENRRFYTMFPNLKCLDVDVETELVVAISELCVNVEKFKIYTLDKNIGDKVYFPKLKELHLDTFFDVTNLCDFIRKHSQTLETIQIIGANKLTYLATIEILNCPKLCYLELDFFRIKNISFCIIAMLNEISLKTKPFTLLLSGSSSSFNFPEDKAIWDKEVTSTITFSG